MPLFLCIMKQLIERIPPFLKNKYVLVLIAAVIWFIFFDQNNLVQQYRLSRQIKNLKQEKEYYQEQIAIDTLQIRKLKENPDELERYAREKYLMKKKDEDIFIVPE